MEVTAQQELQKRICVLEQSVKEINEKIDSFMRPGGLLGSQEYNEPI